MSTPATPLVDAEKTFDPAAFVRERNAAAHASRMPQATDPARPGLPEPAKPKAEEPAKPKAEEAAKVEEAVVPEPAKPEDHDGGQSGRLSRSERRRVNNLLREVGELKGRLSVYEEMGLKPESKTAKPGPAAEAEPKYDDFSDEDAYRRALIKWEAKQAAREEVDKTREELDASAQSQRWNAHLAEMDAKFAEDQKLIPDWAAIAEEAQDLEFTPDEHPALFAMLMRSDQRALVLHHFATHPKAFEDMLAVSSNDPDELIVKFHRLEGRMEDKYEEMKKQKEGKPKPDASPAAQAGTPQEAAKEPPAEPKDRTHPAEEASVSGRTAVDRDVHKPKPTAEVAARGGSAPPEEPPIGSAAWMARRNAASRRN
jgi:hypothetical protein